MIGTADGTRTADPAADPNRCVPQYDGAMTEARDPRAVAAAWRPQRAGRRPARDIADAIVEPAWGGARVVAVVIPPDAAIVRDGEAAAVPDELLGALAAAVLADAAVVEGHLTTEALRSGRGAFPEPERPPRPPLLIPQVVRRSVRDDPFIRQRELADDEARRAAATLASVAEGERHAFVATDLLWLDGQSLLGVPLLERRRILEGVLVESSLVRHTAYVRPTASATISGWRQLGFAEVVYKGTNSRYRPGEVNDDWAQVKLRGSSPATTGALATASPPGGREA